MCNKNKNKIIHASHLYKYICNYRMSGVSFSFPLNGWSLRGNLFGILDCVQSSHVSKLNIAQPSHSCCSICIHHHHQVFGKAIQVGATSESDFGSVRGGLNLYSSSMVYISHSTTSNWRSCALHHLLGLDYSKEMESIELSVQRQWNRLQTHSTPASTP